MATTKPLNEGKSATVAANGIATVELKPNALEVWHVTKIAVVTSTKVKEPLAQVYFGSVAPENLFDGTTTGSLDASECNLDLKQGQSLYCVWSAADVGATATLSVFGTKDS